MIEIVSPVDHSKKNIIHKFDLDKISALEYLEGFGIHTPKTFKDFTEAEKFSVTHSKFIIGRGFALGEADNLCIDIFPSFEISSEEQLKRLEQGCLKIKESAEFAIYANQFGIDVTAIKPQIALQEMVGIPGVNGISIITINNNSSEVIVQIRDRKGTTYGRVFTYNEIDINNYSDSPIIKLDLKRRSLQPLIEAAAQLHIKVQGFLPNHKSIQMEMAAAINPEMSAAELALIQVREVSSHNKNPITWIEKSDLPALEKDTPKLTVKKVKKIQPKENLKLYETLKIDENQPYRLILETIPSPRGTIPMQFQYGNLKELVILDPKAKETCLQHDTYKIMKLVWLRGGKVFIIK